VCLIANVGSFMNVRYWNSARRAYLRFGVITGAKLSDLEHTDRDECRGLGCQSESIRSRFSSIA
jgi:hypothetical protein